MSRKKKKRPFSVPCEVCWHRVEMARGKWLSALRRRLSVRCEQCGGYVLCGRSRVSQVPTEHVVPSLGLRRKVRRGARRTGPLESCPLSRMGKGGLDDRGRNG